MEALQIAVDPGWPKSVTLPQVQDLGDYIARCGVRKMKRRSRPITEASVTVAFVPSPPI
jgi:hypothetical protein